jgi:phosphoglycerate dehydrogenase-like enzyme
VALLGAGAVATKLIELIQHFKLEVIVFDPSLTKERAEGLGVKAVTLGTAFREGLVVSNHLIDNPATVGLIDAELLGSMRRGATFINTGRGRTVRTQDLVQVLSYRHDLTALLDVTDPEPLPDNSPLRGLANVIVSTHIAGAIGDELLRLADCAIEEFDRLRQGKALRYQVFIHDLI